MDKVYIIVGDEGTGIVDVYLYEDMAKHRLQELESNSDGVFYFIETHEVDQ